MIDYWLHHNGNLFYSNVRPRVNVKNIFRSNFYFKVDTQFIEKFLNAQDSWEIKGYLKGVCCI
jgi:hypothetical protein